MAISNLIKLSMISYPSIMRVFPDNIPYKIKNEYVSIISKAPYILKIKNMSNGYLITNRYKVTFTYILTLSNERVFSYFITDLQTNKLIESIICPK